MSQTISTFLATSIPSIVGFTACLCFFIVCKDKFPDVYDTRRLWHTRSTTSQHVVAQSSHEGRFQKFLVWLSDVWSLRCSLDAESHAIDQYLFLRFLQLCGMISSLGCMLCGVFVLPGARYGGGKLSDFDSLTIGNISGVIWAQILLACAALVFFFIVTLLLAREAIFCVHLKAAVLAKLDSAQHAATVLVCNVPTSWRCRQAWNRYSGVQDFTCADMSTFPGYVVRQRRRLADKIEGLLIQLREKQNLQDLPGYGRGLSITRHSIKTQASTSSETLPTVQDDMAEATIKIDTDTIPMIDALQSVRTAFRDCEDDELQSMLKRLYDLVDSYQNCVEQIDEWSQRCPPSSTVFLELKSTQQAQQVLTSREHTDFSLSYPRVRIYHPREVLWSNLDLSQARRRLQHCIVCATAAAMIIGWAIPFAYIGALSSAYEGYFFSEAASLPPAVYGILSGLLPASLSVLALAMMPTVFSYMARYSGVLTIIEAELRAHSFFFYFQLVQVFLVTAIGSTATTMINAIGNEPRRAAYILAERLPAASNFYLCYFMLQSLSIAALTLTNAGRFVLLTFYSRIVDKTPRQRLRRLLLSSDVSLGTLLPVFTTLGVITLCYACLAPVVLFFAAVTFQTAYFAYKYNFLRVSSTSVETHGALQLACLRHLSLGLLVGQLALVGYFAAKVAQRAISSTVPLSILVVSLCATLCWYHLFWRLINRVPALSAPLPGAESSSMEWDDRLLPLWFLRPQGVLPVWLLRPQEEVRALLQERSSHSSSLTAATGEKACSTGDLTTDKVDAKDMTPLWASDDGHVWLQKDFLTSGKSKASASQQAPPAIVNTIRCESEI